MSAQTPIYTSSITTVSKPFKTVKHLFSSSAFRRCSFMFESVWLCVCVHKHVGLRVYSCIYVTILGRGRSKESLFVNDHKPCSLCCGSKWQSLSPVSAEVLLCLPWNTPSFDKDFTAVVEFRGIS